MFIKSSNLRGSQISPFGPQSYGPRPWPLTAVGCFPPALLFIPRAPPLVSLPTGCQSVRNLVSCTLLERRQDPVASVAEQVSIIPQRLWPKGCQEAEHIPERRWASVAVPGPLPPRSVGSLPTLVGQILPIAFSLPCSHFHPNDTNVMQMFFKASLV